MSQYASQLASCAGRFLDTSEYGSAQPHLSRTPASSPASSQVPDEVAAGPSYVPAAGLSAVLVSPNRALVVGGVTRDGRVLPFSVFRYLDLVDASSAEYQWHPAVVIRRLKSAADQDIPVSREAHTLTLDPTTPGKMLLLIGGVRRASTDKANAKAATPCSTLFGLHLHDNRWEELKASAGANPKAKHTCGPRFAHTAVLRSVNASTSSGRRRSRPGAANIYVYGGYSSMNAKSPRSEIHKLAISPGTRDTRSYSWTLVSPKIGSLHRLPRPHDIVGINPPSRAYHAAVLFENRYMIVHGGMTGPAKQVLANLSNELFVFDFETEHWSAPTPIDRASYVNQPSARAYHSAVLGIGADTGHVVFFGGQVENGDYSDEIFRLFLSTDHTGKLISQWTKRHLTATREYAHTAYYGAASAGLLAFAESNQYLVVGGCGPNGLHVAPYTMAPFDETNHFTIKQESSEIADRSENVAGKRKELPLPSFHTSTPNSGIIPPEPAAISPSPPMRSSISASCPTSSQEQSVLLDRHFEPSRKDVHSQIDDNQSRLANIIHPSPGTPSEVLACNIGKDCILDSDGDNHSPMDDNNNNTGRTEGRSHGDGRPLSHSPPRPRSSASWSEVAENVGAVGKLEKLAAPRAIRREGSFSSSESAVLNVFSSSGRAPPRKRPRVRTKSLRSPSKASADCSESEDKKEPHLAHQTKPTSARADCHMSDSNEMNDMEVINIRKPCPEAASEGTQGDGHPSQSDIASPFVTAASVAAGMGGGRDRRSLLRGHGRGHRRQNDHEQPRALELSEHEGDSNKVNYAENHHVTPPTLLNLELSSALRQIEELKNDVQELRQDKDALTDQTQKYLDTIRAREARIESLQKELRTGGSDAQDLEKHILQDEIDKLKDVVRELKYEKEIDLREMKALNATNLELAKDLQETELHARMAAELEVQLSLKNEEVDACKRIISEHVRAANDLRDRSEKLRQRNGALEAEKDEQLRTGMLIAEQARRDAEEKKGEMERLEFQLGQARRNLEVAKNEKRVLENEMLKLCSEKDKLRGELATQSSTGMDAEDACSKRACIEGKVKLRDLERDFDAARQTSALALVELEEKKKEVIQLEKERQTYLADLDRVKSDEQMFRHKAQYAQEENLRVRRGLAIANDKLTRMSKMSLSAFTSFSDFANRFRALQEAAVTAIHHSEVDSGRDDRGDITGATAKINTSQGLNTEGTEAGTESRSDCRRQKSEASAAKPAACIPSSVESNKARDASSHSDLRTAAAGDGTSRNTLPINEVVSTKQSQSSTSDLCTSGDPPARDMQDVAIPESSEEPTP